VTTVRIPPTLRPDAGGEREVSASGSTVREVLADVSGRFPALQARIFDEGNIASFVNVYVGGEDIRTQDGLETPVTDGSTVILLPAMAGGAR
jgi:sulfur-carrier protein